MDERQGGRGEERRTEEAEESRGTGGGCVDGAKDFNRLKSTLETWGDINSCVDDHLWHGSWSSIQNETSPIAVSDGSTRPSEFTPHQNTPSARTRSHR